MNKMNDIKATGLLYDYTINPAAKKDGTPVLNDRGEAALTGRIELAINENGNTIIVEYFGYPTWPSGKVNQTFGALESMMRGEVTSVKNSLAPKVVDGVPNPHSGKSPAWYNLTGNIDVNYFVSKQTKELARSLKIRGAFINPISDEKKDEKKRVYSAVWTADTIVTNIEHIDADDDKELPAYVRLDGYIANYKEELSEVSFQIRDDEVIAKLPVTEAKPDAPLYTMIRGEIVFSKRIVETEDEFGDKIENEYENKVWEVKRFAKEVYDPFDEEVLGIELLQTKVKELADRKQEVVDKNAAGDKKPELNF